MKTYEMGLLYKEGVGIWDEMPSILGLTRNDIEDVTVEEPDDVEARVSTMHNGWLDDMISPMNFGSLKRIADLYAGKDANEWAAAEWRAAQAMRAQDAGVDPFDPDGTLSKEERAAFKRDAMREMYNTPRNGRGIGGKSVERLAEELTQEWSFADPPASGWPEHETTTDIVRGTIDVPVTPAAMPKKQMYSSTGRPKVKQNRKKKS